MPCKEKGTAGVKKKFVGDIKKKSQVVLWTNSTTRYGIVRVGIAWSRDCHHIFEVPKIWQQRMLHGRRSGTRGSSLLEKRENELV